MKRISFLAVALIFAVSVANAQLVRPGEAAPAGTVVYSLPSTTLQLKVTAEHESFVAGPYAKFAQKYLGINAREENAETFTLKSIELIPYVEADANFSMAINLGSSKNANASFLGFSSQGLVVMSDANSAKSDSWRFRTMVDNARFEKLGISSNLANQTTTLYKSVMTSEGLEKVPVQQKQIVEKSIEKKAEETAAMIYKLRQKRVDIVSGDTDATYSGEAMGAALKEIARLEEEYLSLFIGKSLRDEQVVAFDVNPKVDNPKQMYIAFRISETQGLLPATNISGRPIVVEFMQEAEPISQTAVTEMPQNSLRGKIFYRKPVVVLAKIIDGQNVIMQTRVPVYQFGRLLSYPIDLLLK